MIAVSNDEDYVSFYDPSTYILHKQIKFEREVNEFTWDHTGNLFMLTTSSEGGTLGPILCLDGTSLSYPSDIDSLDFHRGKCYCITLDPTGNYFATGAADAYIALWDVNELVPVKSFSKENCQIRQISFSHDGKFIAAAAEDKKLEIFYVDGNPEDSWTIDTNQA